MKQKCDEGGFLLIFTIFQTLISQEFGNGGWGTQFKIQNTLRVRVAFSYPYGEASYALASPKEKSRLRQQNFSLIPLQSLS